MSEYIARIYPYPTVIKCCANCPAFKRDPKSKNFQIYCDLKKVPISPEQFEKALDGEFPQYCPLPLATGRNILKISGYDEECEEGYE